MKKTSALAGFCERFEDILNSMDELDMDENLEELNAQFEDILFLLDSIDENDEDADEEIAGAIEEMQDLTEEYRALAMERTDLKQKSVELEMAVQMAARNLI